MDIHKIATLAATLGKPSKRAAWRLILDVIGRGDGTINLEQLALLYNYFQPPRPKRPKTALDWVAMATDPEHHLWSHTVVCEAGGVMVATNGHRAHLAPAKDAGGDRFLNRHGHEVAPGGSYPLDRLLNIFPSRRTIPRCNTSYAVHELRHCDTAQRIVECVVIKAPDCAPVKLNAQYWDEALAGLGDGVTSAVAGPSDPIELADSAGRRAVIMPVC